MGVSQLASQAQYDAGNAAALAVVTQAIKDDVPGPFQYMVDNYQDQINTVVAAASKAAVDAALGVK